MKISKEQINFGEHIKVFQDKKSQVWSAGIPFIFPDGQNGVITITRLNKLLWKPHVDIDSIVINYEFTNSNQTTISGIGIAFYLLCNNIFK